MCGTYKYKWKEKKNSGSIIVRTPGDFPSIIILLGIPA